MAERIGLEAALEMAGWNRNVDRYMGDIDKMQRKTGGFGSKLGGLGKSVVGMGGKLALGIAGATAAAGAGIAVIATKGVQAAISVESAFTGVTKTTDGLRDEFGNLNAEGQALKDGFLELATQIPITPEQLMSIGELGGQLGVSKDGLLDFTRVIADMGETTNLTTDAAATDMARFAEVMNTVEEEGEDAWSRMGSAIVALGNNFATTESDILAFGQRIAGAGEIAGLTEADVLAIGAAMSSVGVQAEAGGTATQKVLLKMNKAVVEGGKEMEVFAKTMGLTGEEFAALWEEDAGEAFTLFVEGLGIAGDDAMNILADLGMEDQRLMRSFLSLSGAGELLRETMTTSGQAFAENTALTAEAAQRYATTESQMQLMKNTMRDLSITVGEALLPVINDLLQRFTKFVQDHAPEIKAALRTIGNWLAEKLPIAIQTAADFWTNTLYPALLDVGEFVMGTLIPTLQTVWEWLSTNLPPAIQTLSDFWTNTLQPALQTFWEFMETSVLPVLQMLWEWLSVNLPPAIQELADFWTGTLQPALQTLWSFITESFIPALQEIWAFIDANILPIMGALLDVVVALGELGFTVLAGLWENVLKPALEELWEFISTTIIPIIEEFVGWIGEISGGFEGIGTSVSEVVDWLGGLAEAIRNIDLPDWLTPGSATPWERALDSLAKLVQGGLMKAFVAFGKSVQKSLADINELTEDWITLLVKLTEETLPNLQAMFQVVSEYILEQLAEMIRVTEEWRAALEYITSTTLPALQAAFLAMAALIIAALNSMIAKTNEWRRAIEKITNETIKNLQKAWKDAFDKMIGKVQELIDKLVGAEGSLKAAIDTLIEAMETMKTDWIEDLDAIKEKIKEVISRLESAIEKKQELEDGGPAEMYDLADSVTAIADAAFTLAGAFGLAETRARGMLSAAGATAMPAFALPAMAGAGATTNNNVNLSFNTTINSGMDQAMFEGRVRQTVREAMRGN